MNGIVSRAVRGICASAVLFTLMPLSMPMAADLGGKPQPVYGRNDPPPPPPGEPRSEWFIGGFAGYGFADTGLGSAAGSFDFDIDGAIGGGIIGWNYKNSWGLIGLEADITGGSIDGSQIFGGNTVNASIDWMAGLRARAGVNATPDILLFAAIGAAWADIDLPVTGPGGGGGSETFSGFQYGGGAELDLGGSWTARLDYLYTDLDSETITYSGGNTVTYDPDVHQLRAGLLLKF